MGYDGTDQASRALEYAIALVEGNVSELATIHLAYVVQKPSGLADPVPEEVLESLEKMGREVLLNGARIVKKRLENPVTHLEFGFPPEKLLELANELKPDIIVIGMTNHPTSERIMGTVSAMFYKARKFPVLGVP